MKKYISWVAVLIPLLYIAFLVQKYGVNIPFWDQWDFIPVLIKARTGVVTLSDIWAQFNEHRAFFPKLIMISAALLTKWNILYELYINIALAGATLFFLTSILKQSFGKSLYSWLFPILSFLVFSPAQWENWTWGWQIQIFLNVLGFVAAVWAISRWPAQLKGLILAGVFSIVSSFSFNNGLLAWPIIALIFLVRKDVNVRYLAAWLAAFAVVVFLYYKGYEKPSHHPSLMVTLEHPLDYLRYILAYLGSPLGFGNRDISIAIGLVLTVITGVATILILYSAKKERARLSPWLALGVYALLSAFATGVGRLGFGVGQALSSRYTTMSVLLTIASLAIMVIYIEHFVRSRHPIPTRGVIIISSLSTLLALAFVLSFSNSTKELIKRSKSFHTAAICLSDIDRASDECLRILYPGAQVVRDRAKVLQEMNLSLYATQVRQVKQITVFNPVKVVQTESGYVDIFVPVKAASTATIRAVGWAGDLKAGKPVKELSVVADGKQMSVIPLMSFSRPDVAKAYNNSNLDQTGWEAVFHASSLGKGKHKIEFYAVLSNNTFAPLNYGALKFCEVEVTD